MTDIWRWGSPHFPDQVTVGYRASDWSRLVRRPGAALTLGAATFGVAAAALLAIGYVRFEQLTTAQASAVRHAERANADLQEALARLRDQLGVASQTLATTQNRIAALSDETHRQLQVSEQSATSKTDRIAQLTHALDQTQRELHLAEAQRVTLMARLNKSEAEASEGRSRQQQAAAGLDQWQKRVQQLTADRDKAASERDQLRARLSQLEQKLSMRSQQPSRRMAAASPTVAPQVPPAAPVAPARAAPTAVAPVAVPPQTAAPERAVAATAAPAAVAAVSRGGLSQFERVLASTGLDVTRLFAQYGVRTGEGGPFVPVPRGGKLPTLSPEKLAALARMVNTLPVDSPLTSYRLGSPFGVRGDPINGRHEFHTGMDMLAPYMTPVYATAAGVVSYPGYRDDYGKIVEIDHGHGLATRYAHLHRFIVSVGQRITAHEQIGFLGSTGRATGPHVHYEVLVNGEPQDPEKFLGLARLVHVAQISAQR